MALQDIFGAESNIRAETPWTGYKISLFDVIVVALQEGAQQKA